MSTKFHPSLILLLTSSLFLSSCSKSQAGAEDHEEAHRLVVTTPVVRDVVITQEYVAQIHSRRHIELRSLETGYLDQINVEEGQMVKKGTTLFRIVPVLYQAKLDTEVAHAEVQKIKYDNTKVLQNKAIVSNQELALASAELSQAQAQVNLARAELNFANVRAPFDGIVDRQRHQLGSLVEEGDILSTLSDNSVMWVYFNVPESRYLDYKANGGDADLKLELKLANGQLFPQPGTIGAIEADFDNETGNIAFRADFPNPDVLLRHGQTGTILARRPVRNAVVIPQRSTYEILAKKYVFVVEASSGAGARVNANVATHGDTRTAPKNHEHGVKPSTSSTKAAKYHGIVRQREIVIQDEMDDLYVIKEGLKVTDKIIFEGIRQVRDGDNVAYELEAPENILTHLKYHAE